MIGPFYLTIIEDPETTNYFKSNDIRKIIQKIESREGTENDIEWYITNCPEGNDYITL